MLKTVRVNGAKVTQRNLQAKHVWAEQHQPVWNNIAILDHASNINTLRVKEALHISLARHTTKQRSRDSYRGLLETIAKIENWSKSTLPNLKLHPSI